MSKSAVISKIFSVQNRLNNRLYQYSLGLVRRLFGERKAISLFWNLDPRSDIWAVVDGYLLGLSQKSPEILSHFISLALAKSNNSMILLKMAEHSQWAPILAEALDAERKDPSPHVSARLRISENYKSGFLAATQRVGGKPALDEILPRALGSETHRYKSLVDSYGHRLAKAPLQKATRSLPRSGLGSCQHSKHRLVICEKTPGLSMLVPLMRNAEKITLIELNDTLGKLSLEGLEKHDDIGDVVVEHVRTRITRYSADYIEIHTSTRKAAEALVREVLKPLKLVNHDSLPSTEVTISDYLFFQRLKIRAVEALLEDPNFDHVVLATNEHWKGSSFLNLLSGVEGLTCDQRVEVVSISNKSSTRARFGEVVSTLRNGPKVSEGDAYEFDEVMIDEVKNIAKSVSDRKLIFKEFSGRRVLFATAARSPYNASNGRYLTALQAKFDCVISFNGKNAKALLDTLVDSSGEPIDIPIQYIPSKYPHLTTYLDGFLRQRLIAFASGEEVECGVAHVINSNINRLASEVVRNDIIHSLVLDEWFLRLKAEDALPKAVVISPNRAPELTKYSSVARRYCVPSLVLEAHGLDSNYSRYTKLNCDYYGVISTFFRQRAAEGFGIPEENTFVIGSPRIIAPAELKKEAEQVAARKRIAEEVGCKFGDYSATVSYFCQPSEWGHTQRVWRSILGACAENNIAILLKPHPEESPSRINQYLTVAKSLGQATRVSVAPSDPKETILASDIMLTGYSAAALDAVILEKPVVCVTSGNAEYPVPQHKILSTLLARSEAELSSFLKEFLADPKKLSDINSEFLAREAQFRDGPDQRLCELVEAIVRRDDRLPPQRSQDEVPSSLFLDPPHPIFAV